MHHVFLRHLLVGRCQCFGRCCVTRRVQLKYLSNYTRARPKVQTTPCPHNAGRYCGHFSKPWNLAVLVIGFRQISSSPRGKPRLIPRPPPPQRRTKTLRRSEPDLAQICRQRRRIFFLLHTLGGKTSFLTPRVRVHSKCAEFYGLEGAVGVAEAHSAGEAHGCLAFQTHRQAASASVMVSAAPGTIPPPAWAAAGSGPLRPPLGGAPREAVRPHIRMQNMKCVLTPDLPHPAPPARLLRSDAFSEHEAAD